MLVAVDVGNSAIKFGAFEDGRLVAVERMDVRRSLDEDVIPPAHFVAADEAVVLSSSPARTAQFLAWSPRNARLLGDEVRHAVRTTYARPEDLGLDRIAAVLGARALTGAATVVVASVGTAVTVDALDAGGRLVAVAIGPGVRAAADGLHAAAAHLPYPALDAGDVRVPARGTADSIRAGHVLGMAGLVDRLLDEAVRAAGGADAVVVTGGAAPVVAPHLRTRHRHEPHAVLHGICVLHATVPA
jgi:type III pantothenate kinase